MDSLNPSPHQWSYLLDNIKDDKEMLFGVFLRPNGKARTNVKWAELASQLNAQGGAIKTEDKWREAWVGLRARAGSAYRAKVQYAAGTGGGPPPEVVGLGLNPTYERVLQLVGISGAEPNNVPDPLLAQLNARAQRVPASQASGVAVGAAAHGPVATLVPAVQAQQALPQGQRVPAAHASGVAVGAAAHGPAAIPVPAMEAQALQQDPFMPVDIKPDFDKSPIMTLSDICDEATALNIKHEDTISLSDSYSDILTMSPLVIKSENTTVSLSDASDVITLSDTPIQPKNNLHTPPRGSGYTPGAKKKLYDEEQPLSGGSQESTLERQMRLTQRALQENTYAMKQLTEALSKVSWKSEASTPGPRGNAPPTFGQQGAGGGNKGQNNR
ncbi:OTU domain-containing protein 7B [Frankliniella fusca]|uniref:Regulatory protein zeste n=1 Tax=Frankliniella fusca TaxID=407009 RepID=A0AAE1HGK9_9NEOP|nr:OTU domain-containing protein 7B [Frankliniella fusca]